MKYEKTNIEGEFTMTQITPEMIEELKMVFQTKDNCDTTMKRQDEKISDLKIEMANINTKLKIVIALLGVIGTGIPNLLPAIAKILAGM